MCKESGDAWGIKGNRRRQISEKKYEEKQTKKETMIEDQWKKKKVKTIWNIGVEFFYEIAKKSKYLRWKSIPIILIILITLAHDGTSWTEVLFCDCTSVYAELPSILLCLETKNMNAKI